jgi:Lsr2
VSSKVLVILEDDVDGGEATETVEFGLDGTSYAIDLSDANAKKLRSALDGYVSKARKVSGKRSTSRKGGSEVDNRAVRRWAEANGIELSKRGRIPQDVVSQFRAAGN